MNRDQLIKLQQRDSNLKPLFALVDKPGHDYLIHSGVLLRKWRDIVFRQVRLYIKLLYLHSCGLSFCILLMIYLQLATLVLPKLRSVYSDISIGLSYPMM